MDLRFLNECTIVPNKEFRSLKHKAVSLIIVHNALKELDGVVTALMSGTQINDDHLDIIRYAKEIIEDYG